MVIVHRVDEAAHVRCINRESDICWDKQLLAYRGLQVRVSATGAVHEH